MIDVDRTPQAALGEVIEEIVSMLGSLAADLAGSGHNISARAIQEEHRTHFILTVGAGELDMVAGPRGRTAAALQVILRAAGIKQHQVFSLSIRSSRSTD